MEVAGSSGPLTLYRRAPAHHCGHRHFRHAERNGAAALTLVCAMSGGVVEAGHHAGFLVIGVVAVHHPDAGIVRDQGDADFLLGQHHGGVFARAWAAIGLDHLEGVAV